MGNISAKPLTDEYGVYPCKKVHGGRGGKHHWHYHESGDKFKTYLKAWASEATSVKEFESRKELREIFGYFLRRPGVGCRYKCNTPLDNIVKDIESSARGSRFEIYFQNKALTSFPVNLPDYWDEIEKLDLSGNFLKVIPREGKYKHLIMSGNPLTECLDKISVKVQFLDLSNCGLITLTPRLFEYFKSMYLLNEEHSCRSDQLSSEVLYEINMTGNPLSNESVALIEGYALEGYDVPNFDYDKDGIRGLKSRVLAREVKEKIKIQEFLKKERIEEEKKKIAKVKKQERVNKLISHFGIDNVNFLSLENKDIVAEFLNESFPLSKMDADFKEYVCQLVSKIINEDELADIIFGALVKDRRLTFNIINEGFLLWDVEKGQFDDISDDLIKKLRNLFICLEIETKANAKSASSFAQWVSLLQGEIGITAQKICDNYLIKPSKIELIRLNHEISSAEKNNFLTWMRNNKVWQQYQKRVHSANY